jgi:DNA-binding NtrC family response regulator
MADILIVDDDVSARTSLSILLKKSKHKPITAESGKKAQVILSNSPVDLVITDMRMEQIGGLELLQHIKRNYPEVEVVLLTGHGTIESAVESIKSGAFDYVTKPFDSVELLLIIDKALERRSLIMEVHKLRAQLAADYGIDNIISKSSQMRKLLELTVRVAKVDTTILISGESGTGKELIARAIYSQSNRNKESFIAINCGALPENLLESELFGHVKGAFTGAATEKKGLFVEADKGTLFLDEISTTTPSTQVKLLRAIQENEVRPVGSNQSIKVDVRILAATNQDLAAMVKSGEFRDDLYYRLNVIPITLPPLRERTDDILPLAEYFLQRLSKKHDKKFTPLSQETRNVLKSYPWPGNVRELENAIERAAILATSESINPEDLPVEVNSGAGEMIMGVMAGTATLEDIERAFILNTLKKFKGNRVKTAATLGIGRNTLWKKLKDYGIESQD